MQRTDYIQWNEYFMGIASLSSKRSKDPSTQVGACVVNEDNKILGIGYNGFPNGIGDDVLPWNREGEPYDTKYPYVCHAEMNCIMNRTQSLKNCTMYVTMHPCNECTKLIIQSGIKKVIYSSNKYPESLSVKTSERMLELAGISIEHLIL
jgi:dCMP deaminase